MLKSWLRKILLSSGLVLIILPAGVSPVFAAYYKSNCCTAPLPNPQCITILGSPPAGCADKVYYCTENTYCGNGVNSVILDLDPTKNNVQQGTEQTFDVNIFDVRLRFDSDKAISQIIFTGFTAFMGIAALIAVVKGVQASITRAMAADEAKVKDANKSLRNSVAGFALIILSLVIAQLVAALLGIGSLTQITNITRILPGG
jgi:hypothetical protein